MPHAPTPSELRIDVLAGPDRSLTSRPRVGAVSQKCSRLVLPARSEGRHRVEVPLEQRLVKLGDALVYHVFPEFESGHTPASGALEWFEGGYAATGIGIDLEFDDGRELVSSGLRDHHDIRLDAEDQGRSRSIAVDQWTRKSVDLSQFAGTMIRRAFVVMSGHAVAYDAICWADGPNVVPNEQPNDDPRSVAQWVDTRRGTHSSAAFSRGNTLPATARPHGAVFIAPMTSTTDMAWPYSWHLHNDEENLTPFAGLTLSHAATPWFGDWGMFHFTPAPWSESDDGAGRPGRFRHEDERAHPHEYTVSLDNGITVRVAPTRHGAVAQFLFDEGQGAVIFDESGAGGRVRVVRREDKWVVLGINEARGQLVAGAPIAHFAALFDAQPTLDERATDGAWHERLELRFPEERVTVRIAVSLVDAEHALATLHAELPDSISRKFVAADAEDEWSALLGRVSVEGASSDQRITLYSNLYRLFLYPNVIAERSGERTVSADVFAFTPDRPPSNQIVADEVVVNNGFWDTYRTAWPAYTLLAPEVTGRLLDGLLAHYRHADWMPRWTAPGFVDCMVGTSSDNVLADAYVKGIPLADAEAAYDSCLKNALVPAPFSSAGRNGIERSVFLGYVPSEVHEGMSWSLENAVSDFALAQFSQALLDRLGTDHPRAAEFRANERYFHDRSLSYSLLFDPNTGFFRGRRIDGTFSRSDSAFDPREWGGDYVETNAWGMNFTTPHDGEGLATLLGGADHLERRLDRYFEANETADETVWGGYGRQIHEMIEARDVRRGMFGVSNQPAHHIPYMYAFTNAPYKTQSIVRDSLSRLFLGSEFGQGYPGDEDNGEMSCWYLFGAMGLYPLALGTGEYVLTSPLFDEMSVTLQGGRELSVRAFGNTPENVYIQSVHVDGREWKSITIEHAQLLDGCRIEVELGDSPSEWFAGSRPTSASLPGVRPGPLRDIDHFAEVVINGDACDVHSLVDDDSSTSTSVAAGGRVRLESAFPVEARMYSITCGARPELAPTRWSLYRQNGGALHLLDSQESVVWRWPGQTRVFSIADPTSSAAHVFEFRDDHDTVVAELQILAPSSAAA